MIFVCKCLLIERTFTKRTSSLSSILGSHRFDYLLDDPVHLLVDFASTQTSSIPRGRNTRVTRRGCSLAMTSASNSAIWDSLDVGELEDDDSEKWASSRIDATVLSCKSFLFLSALFLLKVASISKSNGTNSPTEDLRVHTLTGTTVKQFKKKINSKLNKY